MAAQSIQAQFDEARQVLEQFLADPAHLESVEEAGKVLVSCIQNGGKILSCGNGGSMSDAMHFAEELSGRYRDNRKALPALAISDSGHLTCVANDFGYQDVFSRMVEALGQSGDVLFAISTSGNSANIVKAIDVAHERGMKVIGLTGKDGGKMAGKCDVEVRVPHFGYADRIQEIHIKVIHALIGYVEENVL
ncbi:D-sedoheptulose 7-phosphate isomerase [bacterium SCSIO 12741]|nr:D-sedoheptulose 7-phosphate isomerase [bacterium SCSIO 12741]